MRAKVIIAVFLAVGVLLAAVALALRLVRPAAPPLLTSQATSSATSKLDEPPPPNQPVVPVGPISSLNVPSVMPASAPVQADLVHEIQVRQRAAELAALGMMEDEASRESIMAEMRNPDKRIRKAARDAIVQFGDRSVVPRLQELAAQTEDAVERKEILDAIEFIKLPSLTEYLAARRERLAAKGLSDPPRPPTNRIRIARPDRTSNQSPAQNPPSH